MKLYTTIVSLLTGIEPSYFLHVTKWNYLVKPA
jgi:hypothetical protein